MAKKKPQQQEAPPDWKPTQAVPDPILNGPYEEPKQHWLYTNGIPQIAEGRREAGYYFTTKKVAAGQGDLLAEEQFDRLELVNRLRKDVARWRESDYRGATQVTRDLLHYWQREDRGRRMFFCQVEAAETLIYLLEIAIPGQWAKLRYKNIGVDSVLLSTLLRGDKPDFAAADDINWPRLVDSTGNDDELGLRRLGCKMATGSGKTMVMAMIITWAFLNRARNPHSTEFPNGVVVCAPNLTVKERLQVLKPEHASNVYDAFDLVPKTYKDQLNAGKILVTNWHAFAPKSEHSEGDASYRVVQKGEESNEAFTKDRLEDLALRLPVLVLNDEGHHCWRPNPSGLSEDELAKLPAEEKKRLEEDKEEARVWLAGLDRINNSGLLGKDSSGAMRPGVLACIDMSATPFYLSNSGYTEGSPFPWLVSDFGLVDAIECGIVKIPRMPVADSAENTDDAGRPDPKYFRLWRNIVDNLKPHEKIAKKPKPDAIYQHAEGALKMLASQWRIQFEERQKAAQGGHFIPPVMIVVCDNTDIAEYFYEKISGEHTEEGPDDSAEGISVEKAVYGTSEVLPEFTNEPGIKRTFRIDSKLLAKIETEEGESKDEAAVALRELIATVGKPGGAGEQVRCVVSVSMLTEGWDANTVTHILGVRAFGSQLLCEQVVGRGLRRMSYEVDPETKKLRAEYVDVYGIPFSLIPFKARKEDDPGPDPYYRYIHSIDERAHMELRFPMVESYTYDVRTSGVKCDVSQLPETFVQDEPVKVYITPTRGYNDDPDSMVAGDFVEQTREAYYATVRMQEVIFRIAQIIVRDLTDAARSSPTGNKSPILARHQIFPDVVRILQEYVDTKVKFADGIDKRELGLERYVQRVAGRVRDGITAAVASTQSPLLPVISRYQPYLTTAGVEDHTTRQVVDLVKSHLSGAIILSEDERKAIDILEDMDEVEFFSPNSRKIGMVIRYLYDGAGSNYEPDFIVRVAGGKTLILEIKGEAGLIRGDNRDRSEAKKGAAAKWVTAVNNSGRDGQWAYVFCDDISRLRGQILAHVPADVATTLPFQRVDAGASDYFKTCIPLTSFRSVAKHLETDQLSFDELVASAHSWITWPGHPDFREGMFVARVNGRSMEPNIPNGAYCLFAPVSSSSREGRTLLVYNNAIRGRDPLTGDAYTLRKYHAQKAIDGSEDFRHTKVTLSATHEDFEPIVFTAMEESDVWVLGEFVTVVG